MLDACSLAPLITKALCSGGDLEIIEAAFQAYHQERFLIAQDATNGSAGLGRLLSRHVSSCFPTLTPKTHGEYSCNLTILVLLAYFY